MIEGLLPIILSAIKLSDAMEARTLPGLVPRRLIIGIVSFFLSSEEAKCLP